MTVPIVEQNKEASVPTRSELLAKYAAKQAKLMELEKQTELLRFELVELQAQLHHEINRNAPDTIKARANAEVTNLKKKVSLIFQNAPVAPIMKKPSTIFVEEELHPLELNKKPSIFFQNNQMVRKTASTVFGNKFLSEVRDVMDQQQADFGKFAKRGSDLARNFFTSLSPKKSSLPESGPETSFVLDTGNINSILDKSILLSDDDTRELGNSTELSNDTSAIDIDDYNSSDYSSSDELEHNF